MEFKGTKGNWTVRGNFKCLKVFSSYGTLCAISRQSSIDSNVDSQAEANAKLIACAPEMLEQLKEILDASYLPEHVNEDIKYILKKATE